jgi:uncharacterized protein (TIGR02271 family)
MAETGIPLRGKDGVRGYAYPTSRDSNESTFVRLDDGTEYFVPSQLFRSLRDGGYALDLGAHDLQKFAAAPRLSTPLGDGSESVSFRHTNTVPLVAEEVTLGKKATQSTVRIEKRVSTREVTIDDPLIREEFEITRVPVNTVIPEAVPPRQEGDTYIVPIFEEVLVTEKRLLLREEVHIVRRRVEVRAPQTVTLRTENIDVHRVEDEHLHTHQHKQAGDHNG